MGLKAITSVATLRLQTAHIGNVFIEKGCLIFLPCLVHKYNMTHLNIIS